MDVNNGSSLAINSSTVTGVFNNVLGGSMTAKSSTFNGATINGDMDQVNATSNTFVNGLTVNGSWNLNAAGNATDMFFNGAQTIDGSGEIVMSDTTNGRIYTSGNALLTLGADVTVRGAGQLGTNSTSILNQGTVLAQGTNVLKIDANGFTNDGVLRAEGSGGLEIFGTSLVNNTSVDVNNGSSLAINSSTVTGVFNNTAGGSMTAQSSTFNGATINGVMDQANATSNTFINGLTVNGSWNLNGGVNATDMFFNGAQTIGGNGEIVMSNTTNSRIFTSGSALLTIGADITVRGAGKLGTNSSSIVNNGTITADQTTQMLIDTSGAGLQNNGTLNATGTGGMTIAAGNFSTSGNVNIAAISALNRNGDYVQTAGQTDVKGSLTATGLVDIQGGILSGDGIVVGNVNNAGTTSPGGSNAAAMLNIAGDYAQSVAGILDIELAGLTSGTEYDVLSVGGTADLSGTLNLSLINGFNPLVGNSFDILTADTINGAFDVLNLTLGAGYTWSIDYLFDTTGINTVDVVRLTVLTAPAVPVPAAVWLFGSGLLGLVGIARRRRVH